MQIKYNLDLLHGQASSQQRPENLLYVGLLARFPLSSSRPVYKYTKNTQTIVSQPVMHARALYKYSLPVRQWSRKAHVHPSS